MDYGLRMTLGGGMFFWIIPLILVVIVIFSAFKAFGPERLHSNTMDDPLEILNIRFAKGELTEEE